MGNQVLPCPQLALDPTIVSAGAGDAHRESSRCLSLLPFCPTAFSSTTSPPIAIQYSISYCSQRQICGFRPVYPRVHGPTTIPVQPGPCSHSLAPECPKSDPSSLAMETPVQPSCRGQPLPHLPQPPLQTRVWSLVLPTCLNRPCAVTCVPMLRRVCRAGPQRERPGQPEWMCLQCCHTAPLSPSRA